MFNVLTWTMDIMVRARCVRLRKRWLARRLGVCFTRAFLSSPILSKFKLKLTTLDLVTVPSIRAASMSKTIPHDDQRSATSTFSLRSPAVVGSSTANFNFQSLSYGSLKVRWTLLHASNPGYT